MLIFSCARRLVYAAVVERSLHVQVYKENRFQSGVWNFQISSDRMVYNVVPNTMEQGNLT